MTEQNGRLAVVTGGGSGIGAATVRDLVERGYTVAALDLAFAQTPDSDSSGVLTHVVDVTDREAVRVALAAIDAERPIEALVTCAGVYRPALALDASDADYDFLFGINVRGTFVVAQETARLMADRGRGAIVTVSSVSAQRSTDENVVYAASKGAVESLTRGFAVSLAPHGIRVNGVRPGPIETPQGLAAVADPAYRERMLKSVLRGRLGAPEDVARAAAFLVSDDADFVTGEILTVDGGVMATR